MHAIFNHPLISATIALSIVLCLLAYVWIASAGINDCDRAKDI
jgi:hypothetical protein